MSIKELPPKIKESRDAMRKEFALEAMKIFLAAYLKKEFCDVVEVAFYSVLLADHMIDCLSRVDVTQFPPLSKE